MDYCLDIWLLRIVTSPMRIRDAPDSIRLSTDRLGALMRLDFLCPLLLVVAVACSGDDDGMTDDGDDDGATDGATSDAGGETPDAGPGNEADAGDVGPDGGGTGAKCDGTEALKCEETHYCDWRDDGCGNGEALGICVERPSECDPRDPPACACDGQSYDSACEAAKAGHDVAAVSICEI
jgi:hypothetical protein